MSMSFQLRSSHYLLLIHLLLSHPDMLPRDDANDEDEEDEDKEEEEEHLAPADSAIVVPIDEPVFPPEGIEP
ncbi:hypothetical protein Tco_0619006, partial [Tanacetum coccineum]